MTDERQPEAAEGKRAPVERDAAAFAEMLSLCERLAGRTSELRGDAERALDRAASLRAARDPRAGIAVSACREALGAYRDTVAHSLRQACAAASVPDDEAPAGEPEPAGAPAGPVPATAGPVRHKVARALAAAAVTGVLGLVGWGGLPSWSTVTATSAGQVTAQPSVTHPTAGVPERSARAADLSAGAAAEPETSRRADAGLSDPDPSARTGQRSRDVRRLLASTLPGVAETLQSAADGVGALRAIGDAAASPSPAGERVAPADAGSRPGAAGPALPDSAEALDEAADAVDRRLPGGGDVGDGGLPEPPAAGEVDDADELDEVTGDGQELTEGGASDGEGSADREEAAVLDGDERSGSPADGVSGDAGLSR